MADPLGHIRGKATNDGEVVGKPENPEAFFSFLAMEVGDKTAMAAEMGFLRWGSVYLPLTLSAQLQSSHWLLEPQNWSKAVYIHARIALSLMLKLSKSVEDCPGMAFTATDELASEERCLLGGSQSTLHG